MGAGFALTDYRVEVRALGDGNCCSTQPAPLSDEEKGLRRSKMAEAAEARALSFNPYSSKKGAVRP